MLPTDPKVISSVPNENRSIAFGTFLGLSTVLMGTKLINSSPLQSTHSPTFITINLYLEPVHLVVGGVLGAIGGLTMQRLAKAAENRVLIGEDYHNKRN